MGSEIQRRNLIALAGNGGFKFTDLFFPYTSGEVGPYYVNSENIANDGPAFSDAVEYMSELIFDMMQERETRDYVITGGETRDWIFSNPVAIQLGLDSSMIYKNGKIVGSPLEDRRVIHIADLNNEGSSPRDYWIPIIKKNKGLVNDIFFYVDRMEDGVEEMTKLGLHSHAIVPLDENAWNYLKNKKVINQEVHNNLIERMENKDEWARAMLRSDKGLEKLAPLIDTPENNAKALKILNKGYPDMKEEIMATLKQKHYID